VADGIDDRVADGLPDDAGSREVPSPHAAMRLAVKSIAHRDERTSAFNVIDLAPDNERKMGRLWSFSDILCRPQFSRNRPCRILNTTWRNSHHPKAASTRFWNW
jgi:hypothetical protein